MWTFRVNFGESRFAFGRIFSFGLLLFSASLGLVTLSGCRLNDNRIRGSYGSYPSRDGTPDSFSFADKKNASLSTLYFAEIVQIGGINKKVDIAVSGDGNPEYRVCSDASCAQEVKGWSASPGADLVENGNYVQLRLTSSSSYGSLESSYLRLGETSANWNVTTMLEPVASNKGTWKQLEAGSYHTCGLESDSKAYCWGSDSDGQLGENADGDNLNEDIPVLVDTSALTPGASFITITAGRYHTCGLSSDGKAYCWGDDGYGQLGENADGDNLNEDIPVEVDTSTLSTGANFISITAGNLHTCGLSSDGKAYCWGWDGRGQLGENSDGDNLNEDIPVLVDTSALTLGASFISIQAGQNHACGLASDGKAYCWGWDNDGQLGENSDGDNLDEIIPVLVDTTALSPNSYFVAIESGSFHTCGLASDGRAYCWGWDSDGQLGENSDGDNLDEVIPVQVDDSPLSPGTNFISLAPGLAHTCGLASDGKSYCWGRDSNGQLGESADGDNLDEDIPVPVDLSSLSSGTNFISLTAGSAHTCGLASDGKGYCWGLDDNGRLGEDDDGDNLDEDIPVLVDSSVLNPIPHFISVVVGAYHSCGISSDGKAYCWGSDSYGQLGEDADGDNLNEDVPVLVDISALSMGSELISLTAGNFHTCGLASDGKAYCWGSDTNGQLGENADLDNLDENIPMLVDTSALTSGSNFVMLTAGSSHTCGLASDGKAYCWGSDTNGQLGEDLDLDNSDEKIPVLVDTSALTLGSSFFSLTAGYDHTCGLSSDGRTYCWGADLYGQLGEDADLDNADENIPVLVDTSALNLGANFTSLTAGAFHTCGLASDGKAYCWGRDDDGQLGENADLDNLDEKIPVLVDTSALTSGSSFVAIAAGYAHTCGLSSDGKAFCWGRDTNGQLGEDTDLDNLDENIPVQIDTSALDTGSSFVSLAAGQSHSCGLSSKDKVFCWGRDTEGQLGDSADGDNLDEVIPVGVDDSALLE